MKRIKLTQGFEAIVDDEDYDWVSQWKWRVRRAKNNLYAQANKVEMHRLILSAKRRQIVDHINMNGLDNRKSNLRFCNKSQNAMNSKIYAHNSSGYRGVHLHNKTMKYRAAIKINGQKIHLILTNCPVEAAKYYDWAAITYFGEFARLNFPQDHGIQEDSL